MTQREFIEQQRHLPLRVKMNLLQGFSEAVRKLQVERAYQQYQKQVAQEKRANALAPASHVVIRRYKGNADANT